MKQIVGQTHIIVEQNAKTAKDIDGSTLNGSMELKKHKSILVVSGKNTRKKKLTIYEWIAL